MKMYKTLCLASLISAISLTANADTFKIKGGKTYEGKISLETEDSYILLVEVRKGIRDEITVKKSDVKSISKTVKKDNSLKDFEALKAILPTANFLEEADYKRLIATRLKPLLKRFPNSPHRSIATEIESTLVSELVKVKMGEIKFDGEWLTPDQVSANQFEIDSQLKSNKVLTALKKRQYSEAFSELDLMKKSHRSSKGFQLALEQSLRALPRYRKQVARIISKADEEKEKRDQAIARLSFGESSKLQRSLDKEEAQYKSALNKSNATRSKWLPLNRFHPENAQKVLEKIDKEVVLLEELRDETFVDAGELYRNALSELANDDVKTAAPLIQQFLKTRSGRSYNNTLKNRKKEVSDAQKQLHKQKQLDAAELRRIEKQAKIDAKKAIQAEKEAAKGKTAK